MSEESKKAYLEYLTENELEKSGVKKTPVDPMVFEKDSPYANTQDQKKPIQPMVFDVPTKSFEDKIYILLIVGENNDSIFDGHYKICNGRTECYRHIQTLIEAFGEDIDVHQSMVITETKQTETDTGNKKYYLINYQDSLSMYAFCKSVESFYSNDTFSIDDYFEPPKPDDLIKSTFEDVSSAYATTDDPVMAKVIADSIQERNDKIKSILGFPGFARNEAIKASGSAFDAKKEFPMLFDDDGNGVNV